MAFYFDLILGQGITIINDKDFYKMRYDETRILNDFEEANFDDSLSSALEELKKFGSTRPSLTSIVVSETFIKAEFRLDASGSPSVCVHLANMAAAMAEWEDVTFIKFIMLPRQNTASFEMLFQPY